MSRLIESTKGALNILAVLAVLPHLVILKSYVLQNFLFEQKSIQESTKRNLFNENLAQVHMDK